MPVVLPSAREKRSISVARRPWAHNVVIYTPGSSILGCFGRTAAGVVLEAK